MVLFVGILGLYRPSHGVIYRRCRPSVVVVSRPSVVVCRPGLFRAKVNWRLEVLERCLEVRESVMELLAHREQLVECLELREGVQTVLGSYDCA